MQETAYAHERMAAACQATADPVRVRILATLIGAGELCVCHVEEALGITQSRASRHLAALRRAGLVHMRREGAWVHYRVARPADQLARGLLRLAREVARDPGLVEDAQRARALRGACGFGGEG